MVKKRIGVIGIQGAITEHIHSMRNALMDSSIKGEVLVVKDRKQIKFLDALIIPGGESTTISKLINKFGFEKEILKRIENKDLALMGTCAGCTILASELIDNFHDLKLLNAMNIAVKRNAFGGQKESFEQKIKIKIFKHAYNAVFIRAPAIEKIWNNCEILAKIDDKIVMARQDNLLAMSFHPELTDDLRIHKYFLDII
jgi:5'-phosphate synthase pdxT subunit